MTDFVVSTPTFVRLPQVNNSDSAHQCSNCPPFGSGCTQQVPNFPSFLASAELGPACRATACQPSEVPRPQASNAKETGKVDKTVQVDAVHVIPEVILS